MTLPTGLPAGHHAAVEDVAPVAPGDTVHGVIAQRGLTAVAGPSSDRHVGSRTVVRAIGVVLVRPSRTLGVETFFTSFFAGLESHLGAMGISLLLHYAPSRSEELETYRRWWTQGRVDGLVLLDLTAGDTRPGVCAELGLPAVVVGDPVSAGSGTAVWTDDATAVRATVRRLAELGHRRLARVSERPDMVHAAVRTAAFVAACRELGLPHPQVASSDLTTMGGRRITIDLLSRPRRPTAILYDNDLMAVAGLAAAQEIGLDVPRDVSLVAYDDSLLCEVTNPALTAVSHDVHSYGVHAAKVLLRVIGSVQRVPSELDSVPQLIERGSTGRAPISAVG
jgi:DNA-binding LacI/PurR family transcriptional regulator